MDEQVIKLSNCEESYQDAAMDAVLSQIRPIADDELNMYELDEIDELILNIQTDVLHPTSYDVEKATVTDLSCHQKMNGNQQTPKRQPMTYSVQDNLTRESPLTNTTASMKRSFDIDHMYSIPKTKRQRLDSKGERSKNHCTVEASKEISSQSGGEQGNNSGMVADLEAYHFGTPLGGNIPETAPCDLPALTNAPKTIANGEQSTMDISYDELLCKPEVVNTPNAVSCCKPVVVDIPYDRLSSKPNALDISNPVERSKTAHVNIPNTLRHIELTMINKPHTAILSKPTVTNNQEARQISKLAAMNVKNVSLYKKTALMKIPDSVQCNIPDAVNTPHVCPPSAAVAPNVVTSIRPRVNRTTNALHSSIPAVISTQIDVQSVRLGVMSSPNDIPISKTDILDMPNAFSLKLTAVMNEPSVGPSIKPTVTNIPNRIATEQKIQKAFSCDEQVASDTVMNELNPSQSCNYSIMDIPNIAPPYSALTSIPHTVPDSNRGVLYTPITVQHSKLKGMKMQNTVQQCIQPVVKMPNSVQNIKQAMIDIQYDAHFSKQAVNNTPHFVQHGRPVKMNTPNFVQLSKPLVINTSKTVQHGKPVAIDTPNSVKHSEPVVMNTSNSPRHSKPDVINTPNSVQLSKPEVINSQNPVQHCKPVVMNTLNSVQFSKPAMISTPKYVQNSKPAVTNTSKSVQYSNPSLINTPNFDRHNKPAMIDLQNDAQLSKLATIKAPHSFQLSKSVVINKPNSVQLFKPAMNNTSNSVQLSEPVMMHSLNSVPFSKPTMIYTLNSVQCVQLNEPAMMNSPNSVQLSKPAMMNRQSSVPHSKQFVTNTSNSDQPSQLAAINTQGSVQLTFDKPSVMKTQISDLLSKAVSMNTPNSDQLSKPVIVNTSNCAQLSKPHVINKSDALPKNKPVIVNISDAIQNCESAVKNIPNGMSNSKSTLVNNLDSVPFSKPSEINTSDTLLDDKTTVMNIPDVSQDILAVTNMAVDQPCGNQTMMSFTETDACDKTINMNLKTAPRGKQGMKNIRVDVNRGKAAAMNIPEAVPRGNFKPVVASGEITIVTFDLETTDLIQFGEMPHITQIAVENVQTGSSMSVYVRPKQPISYGAENITGITMEGDTMMVHGRRVECLSIREALIKLCDWLENFTNVVLVAHNGRRFDFRIIITALMRTKLVEPFSYCVLGFVDSLTVFRKLYPKMESYKQEDLVHLWLVSTYDTHNAKTDTAYLSRLLKYTKMSKNEMLKFSFSPSAIVNSTLFNEGKFLNMISLQCLVSADVCKRYTAENIAGSGLNMRHLIAVYQRFGTNGLRHVFTTENSEGAPRVTNSKRVLDEMLPKLGKFIEEQGAL